MRDFQNYFSKRGKKTFEKLLNSISFTVEESPCEKKESFLNIANMDFTEPVSGDKQGLWGGDA